MVVGDGQRSSLISSKLSAKDGVRGTTGQASGEDGDELEEEDGRIYGREIRKARSFSPPRKRIELVGCRGNTFSCDSRQRKHLLHGSTSVPAIMA